jgi:hypothetical protein
MKIIVRRIYDNENVETGSILTISMEHPKSAYDKVKRESQLVEYAVKKNLLLFLTLSVLSINSFCG